MIQYGVITHGGAGSPPSFTDGCKSACEAAFKLLEAEKNALDAVVEAARILEDDGRFNAGSGSVLRLDGKTVEMDAAVMDSNANIGAVIAIRDIKNPILVARAVMDTPHVALSGQGAMVFAKKRGFELLDHVSLYSLERFRRVVQLIEEGRLGEVYSLWKNKDLKSLWNFEEIAYEDIFFSDTIGVVAIDRNGNLAAANSTGGIAAMMLGRVGDSSMIGCGLYAGPACALAATGVGEEIIKRMLSKTVYDMVSQGEDINSVCIKGISMFPREIPAGIVGISKTGYAVASNIEMAHYVLLKEV